MNTNRETRDLLRLRPPRAAKVSEISEAVAASSIPSSDRVNFHIGNPIQDPILTGLALRTMLGLHSDGHDLCKDIAALAEALGIDPSFHAPLTFFQNTLRRSAAYMPRGGFAANQPGDLIRAFHRWLTEEQPDPLDYALGAATGKRECSMGSGGKWEALRVFLTALSTHLETRKATVFVDSIDLPEHLSQFPKLTLCSLNSKTDTVSAVQAFFRKNDGTPAYLILGGIPDEDRRRQLRRIAMEKPLMIVEFNDAPNAVSMAREARLQDQVLRFLTPAVLSSRFTGSSLFFLCGNAAYIQVFDIVHFRIKGTPSASEIALLEFLAATENAPPTRKSILPDADDCTIDQTSSLTAPDVSAHLGHLPNRISNLVARKIANFETHVALANRKASNGLAFTRGLFQRAFGSSDEVSRLPVWEFWTRFLTEFGDPQWFKALDRGLRVTFSGHHPEYHPDDCVVVSGSARTALSYLGFHCGIEEIIAPDLSWTYEHCFPCCRFVPLTDSLDLDIEKIENAVLKRLEEDPNWVDYGALCLSNPHNSSGKIFDEADLEDLCLWALSRGIRVIDDLAYRQLAPMPRLPHIKTLRELVVALVRAGKLTQKQGQNLITIHSLSKTDCFAGARLAMAHIPDPALRQAFRTQTSWIQPNATAIFFSILFYRCSPAHVRRFWKTRNVLFHRRLVELQTAFENLPDERNPYAISLHRPEGAMYPHMVIEKLPAGVSLDWLASGLAKQGIGLIPLTTFARTAEGFELARRSFRLTLGGGDFGDTLARKTRRVLIDLNRKIAVETSRYTLKSLPATHMPSQSDRSDFHRTWLSFADALKRRCVRLAGRKRASFGAHKTEAWIEQRFFDDYLPSRILDFGRRFCDYAQLTESLKHQVKSGPSGGVLQLLERELYKQPLDERQTLFRRRLFDRTVHPTQTHSLPLERLFWDVAERMLKHVSLPDRQKDEFAHALWEDYLCRSVSINSVAEADELLIDLSSLIHAEDVQRLSQNDPHPTFLSFWGDWDGSTRPSGQGHRLVASVLLQNIANTIALLTALMATSPAVKIDPDLQAELARFPNQRQHFWRLLNSITTLTNQLEQRFRSMLPIQIAGNRWRDFFAGLGLARTSLSSLWEHNDRLEKRMQALRKERRSQLAHFFNLDKLLRKTMYANLGRIRENVHDHRLSSTVARYHNLLHRVVLTPRIHQKTITSKDPFSIETTAKNLVEINELSGRFGHPGMVLALQVSMATEAEALIALDRRLRACAEKSRRDWPNAPIAPIWTIPLFEDKDTIINVERYLDQIWNYCVHSRRMDEPVENRFSEMICELFIAGSDLSQQIGQTAAARLYKEAKFKIFVWLARRGLADRVRLKLGCGEPMQRQGGYYAAHSGQASFLRDPQAQNRLKDRLQAATAKSAQLARSPLAGVLSSGDLRTFQSKVFETLRGLDLHTRAEILSQVREAQTFHDFELARASEPLKDTRLRFETQGVHDLMSLTVGPDDDPFRRFTELTTDTFRQILYGREEDVVGIHAISYFISQTVPTLRDRPTVRPSRHATEHQSQRILEKIADTIPFAKHGTLLRAIGHNRAQTMILGLNQLTTGLFRALSLFAQEEGPGADPLWVAEDVFPHLPVYEILHTMRVFHDPELTAIHKMVAAFPPGTSAFPAVREDLDAFHQYRGTFQKELLRRQGVHVADFFNGADFDRELLPTLRPDLAVLMQNDLFNTDMAKMLPTSGGTVAEGWQRDVDSLLQIRRAVLHWRNKIWELLERPVFEQVKSFVALSHALNNLARQEAREPKAHSLFQGLDGRIKPSTLGLLKRSPNEPLRQFLGAATQYLHQWQRGRSEVPLEIIRALKDVERILIIERKAVTKPQLDRLNFYVLQMARVCGENG